MTSRNDRNRQPMRSVNEIVGMNSNIPILDPNAPARTQFDPFFKGELPDAGWTPFGAMLAVQVVRDENGKSAEGIIIPESVKSWGSRIFIVIAAGPEAKYAKRGDWVLSSRDIVPQVVCFKDVETLYLHEQQCFGFVNEVRECYEANQKAKAENGGQNYMAAALDAPPEQSIPEED